MTTARHRDADQRAVSRRSSDSAERNTTAAPLGLCQLQTVVVCASQFSKEEEEGNIRDSSIFSWRNGQKREYSEPVT